LDKLINTTWKLTGDIGLYNCDAMENVLDVMENDLLPALEEAQGLQDDIGDIDIDDDGSESQQERYEQLLQRSESV
tara:strand:- start:850 stop:1077 length:228 start_codon:yes stop_codon:yes gene_type:complete